MDRWFWDGERWHAHKVDREFKCGMVLVSLDEADLVLATEESPVPPKPCSVCLRVVAMEVVEDESLGHAKKRGYVPAD